MARQPHLLVQSGDLHDVVLLPGDPGRVDRIADRCQDAETVAENREYKVVNAISEGTPITICSTGIGCPSAAIALEELAAVGASTAIRVGTTGALQPDIDIGDLIVPTAAAKDEGTTRRYESDTIPAVASVAVLSALLEAATAEGRPVHTGPIVTDDAYYAETEEYVAKWREANLLSVEMEAAAVFSLARRKGLRAGAICTVDGNLVRGTQKGETEENEELPVGARKAVDDAIDIALAAARALAE